MFDVLDNFIANSLEVVGHATNPGVTVSQIKSLKDKSVSLDDLIFISRELKVPLSFLLRDRGEALFISEYGFFEAEFDRFARASGVPDIYQDNGGRLFKVLRAVGLTPLAGRHGNDASDCDGKEYEVKTVSSAGGSVYFSTHRQLTQEKICQYNLVCWVFAIFEGVKLTKVYKTEPGALSQIFLKWSKRLEDEGIAYINNPKIPLKFIKSVGERIL